jgi:hypothetical protein
VFTARYALSPYIKQIRFVFKGLIYTVLYWRLTFKEKEPSNTNNVKDRILTGLPLSSKDNQNTHFMSSNVSRQSCRLWDSVEKYGTARQATDDNMVHALCMQDT